ncbi:MAG: hypothetical protein ACOWWO_03570 [Peptococcaceae bacterium]
MKTSVQGMIEEGSLVIQDNLKQYPYLIRLLTETDLMAVMNLQSKVLDGLKRQELCVPIPAEELRQMLENRGEIIGLFIHEKLYAVCAMLLTVDYEKNMARELNFTAEQLSQVAQFELSLVDSELQGLKLQQRLAAILAQRVEKRKQARYLFTTVSPYNYASIQTVTSLGLQITKLTKMYYGWDRYIVYKDFGNPVKLDLANPVIVANTSFEEQHQLLNDGYRGFSQYQDQEGSKIVFAKPFE